MAVKPIFGTYPYLRIAKKFDVDYGDVIITAGFMTHGHGSVPNCMITAQEAWNRLESTLDARLENAESGRYQFGLFLSDMADVRDNFKRIQAEGWDQS